MSTKKRKFWKVWCVTDSKWVKVWKTHDASAPTICPDNAGHTITSSLTSVESEEEPILHEATSDPTIDDDFDAGYDIGAKWTNKTSDKVFECTDSTVGAAIWKDTTSTGEMKVEELNFLGEEINTASYTVISCGTFIFRGTDVIGLPTKFIASVTKAAAATSIDVRIYDIENEQTICSASETSATEKIRKDLGTVSNLPASESIFEVQVKRTGTLGKVRCYALSIQW